MREAVDGPAQRPASGVLADRIAAALVHREPGWRLPRRSALARRYDVSLPEIDVAIAELVRRSLIRRLPDGQMYRASPAEYLIPVEGVTGLATRLDPMGASVTCEARYVSQRNAPRDVAWALGADGDAQVRIVRSLWVTDGEPAALSIAYVREPYAESPGVGGLSAGSRGEGPADTKGPGAFAKLLRGVPAEGAFGGSVYARAVDLDLSPPKPSVARSLRLVTAQLAVSVTIRFDDAVTREPVGLTVVILRPELFRVVIHAGDPLAL